MSNTINTIQIKRGTTAPGENTLLPYELGYTVNRYLNGSALVENSGGGYLYIGDLKQDDATKSLPVKIKAGYADTAGVANGLSADVINSIIGIKVSYAGYADSAGQAVWANKAGYADSAGSATNATNANYANYANSAGQSNIVALTRLPKIFSWPGQGTMSFFDANGYNSSDPDGIAIGATNENCVPLNAWWYIARFCHGNDNKYYTDLAIPFTDSGIFYKRINNKEVSDGGWVKVLDSKNYSSFALPISGGTLSVNNSSNQNWLLTLHQMGNQQEPGWGAGIKFLNATDNDGKWAGIISHASSTYFNNNSLWFYTDGGTHTFKMENNKFITPFLVVTESYGTGDPSGSAFEGQLYFKVVSG